jgi:thiosulfate/3-mercaptopyruvate sulfurtransferase
VSALIDAAELSAALASAGPPALLDVRWQLGGPPGIEAYRAGHLPGAAFVDLDRDLAGPPGRGGRHPLPDAGRFQAAMRRCGVRGDRAVVVYDQRDTTAAARAWWLLGYHGHTDVRVLDGGYDGWVARGFEVTTEVAAPDPGDFTARPGQRPLLDAAGAAEVASGGILLDARAPERYRGEVEPVDPVAGHVPGARGAPATGNLTGDGHLRPPGELREQFAAVGVRDDRPVGAYCGSGVVAASEVLALEVAGYDAALYVGSWSDWITDPSRPVATGDPGQSPHQGDPGGR